MSEEDGAMHAGPGPHWEAREDASRPVLMALYLRDALGIVDPTGLPRLLGTGIPVVEAPTDARVGWAWTRLWAAIVEPESRIAELPLDGPPEFDAAVRRHLDDARTFAQVAHDEYGRAMVERMRSRPRDGLVLTELVAAREAALGRPAHPFSLRIEVLPLTAPGVWWIAESAIAVDELLLGDPGSYRAALEPIIERLA